MKQSEKELRGKNTKSGYYINPEVKGDDKTSEKNAQPYPNIWNSRKNGPFPW